VTAAAHERGVDWGMQALLARRTSAIADGADPVGWKIGLNASAVQHVFGLDGPVVGSLVSNSVLTPGQPCDVGGWVKPALEVEVAIRVGADGRMAALAPALELVDLGDFFSEIGHILAANICHRGVVFGQEITGGDLDRLVSELQVEVTSSDGDVRATGTLDEPPSVTVEVVRGFLGTHGATLEAGQRIIAGSLITPLAVAAGDQFEIDFGPLGKLEITFELLSSPSNPE
jgi:2-oxo-hept-3-ene-1,7-dioate hydratase